MTNRQSIVTLFAVGAMLLLTGSLARAQAATVLYDAPTGTTLAQANSWAGTLYVNNQAFQLTQTCTQAGVGVVTCSAPLPNVAAALAPTGPQNFEVTWKDAVLGEGPRSAVFIRNRPSAPTNGRFQ